LRDRVEKQNFHLEGLELEEHMENMKERVPTEEENPREAPHEPLRLPVAGGEAWRGEVTGHRERERERLREKATVQGFKYP
jgi:hypothetical protein